MKTFRYLLFTACTVGVAMTGSAWATGARGNSNLVGHYEGTFDLSPIGIPRIEDLSFILESGGTVTLVTEEQWAFPSTGPVVEHESPALGTWKRVGHNRVKIGVVQFRNGSVICNRFLTPGMCTLRIGVDATVDRQGHMTGNVQVVVEQGANSFVFRALIPMDAQSTSVDDFLLP